MSTKEWIEQTLAPVSNDVLTLLSKVMACVFYLSIGLMTIIGDKLMKGKSIRNWKTVGSLLVALGIGSLSASWCLSYSPEKCKYVVPLCTMFSEKLFILLSDWVEKKFKKTLDKDQLD